MEHLDTLGKPVGFGPYARLYTWYQVALLDPRHVLKTMKWLEGHDSEEWKSLGFALSDLYMAITKVKVPATTLCRRCKTVRAIWWISGDMGISSDTEWSEDNLHVFCGLCEQALGVCGHSRYGNSCCSISLQVPFAYSSSRARDRIMAALTILLDLPVNPTPEQARQFFLPYLPPSASSPSR